MSRLGLIWTLTKPRMVAMILVATAVGYELGRPGPRDPMLLLILALGTALVAGGTLALNQVLEQDVDGLMERTRERPLPSGGLSRTAGLGTGVLFCVGGLLVLAFRVNPLCAAVTAAVTVSYLFLYTPMKQTSAYCTLWGGIPGALPPVAGWAAARGSLDFEAWLLFAILYLWQLPHALAIAIRYREDYARGGVKLLPTVLPEGRGTGWHVVLNCLALLAATLLPTLVGMAGKAYFIAALVLGLAFLGFGIALASSGSVRAARNLVVASLVYLPALFAALALDRRP